MKQSYKRRYVAGGHPVAEHIIVAERAVGKRLPSGAHVHHVNGNKKDNSNGNLVVCPTAAYHSLLHKRMKALEESGNANYLKCGFCKRYDDPLNLSVKTRKVRGAPVLLVYHSSCNANAAAEYRARVKQ